MISWAYLDGRWVDASEPQLHLSTQGLHYGTAVFEGIRAYRPIGGGALRPFRAKDHFERFLASCEALRIEPDESTQDLVDLTFELIQRNGYDDDCYVRPVAFKRSLLPGVPFGVRVGGVSHGIALTAVRMPSRAGRPTRLGISGVRRVPHGSLPTRAKISGAYVAHALAIDECTADGYDDALLLNAQGRVAEASTSNILVRHGRTVATPSPDQDILPGITRSVVLELARDAGYDVVERPVEVAELFGADEVVLVGTGVEISPVTSVSRRAVGTGVTGPLAHELCSRYERLVRSGGER